MSRTRKAHLDGQAVGLVLVCCAVWGLGQVAAKTALEDWSPLQQVALRSGGALALLWLFCLWRGISLWRRDGTLWAGMLAGLLFALEFVCIFSGLQFTGASRMAVLIYLAPFFVALGMPLIAREERLTARQWMGLGLAFAGVAWAMSEGLGRAAVGQAAGPQWWGDALGVAGAIFWALTTLVIRASALNQAAPEKTLAYQLMVSALAVGAWVLLTDQAWPALSALHSSPTIALVFQTVVVTFASYLTWFWLIRHYPATGLSAFTLLTPVAGLAFGVLLLNEPLTLRLVTAVLAVAAGLWLVSRR